MATSVILVFQHFPIPNYNVINKNSTHWRKERIWSVRTVFLPNRKSLEWWLFAHDYFNHCIFDIWSLSPVIELIGFNSKFSLLGLQDASSRYISPTHTHSLSLSPLPLFPPPPFNLWRHKLCIFNRFLYPSQSCFNIFGNWVLIGYCVHGGFVWSLILACAEGVNHCRFEGDIGERSSIPSGVRHIHFHEMTVVKGFNPSLLPPDIG